jgi:hypothetical protein
VSKPLKFLVFLLISGCGGAYGTQGWDQGEVFYVCDTPTHFAHVISDIPINCQIFEHNENLAFEMLANANLVPVGSEHDYSDFTIHVVSGDSFSFNLFSGICGNSVLLGQTNEITQTIMLGDVGEALIHEMIHHWEWIHGVLDTAIHPNWCQKDYGGKDSGDCPGSLSYNYAASVYQYTRLTPDQ